MRSERLREPGTARGDGEKIILGFVFFYCVFLFSLCLDVRLAHRADVL